MEQLDLFSYKPKRPKRTSKAPQEYKVVALRESPHSNERVSCETPEHVAEYWRTYVATAPWYSNDQECFVVIFLNTRRKVLGHNLVTLGLLDTVLAHPRETFRAAIVLAAHLVVVAHNLCAATHKLWCQTIQTVTHIAVLRFFSPKFVTILPISLINHETEPPGRNVIMRVRLGCAK